MSEYKLVSEPIQSPLPLPRYTPLHHCRWIIHPHICDHRGLVPVARPHAHGMNDMNLHYIVWIVRF
jgi:hypothetical protein